MSNSRQKAFNFDPPSDPGPVEFKVNGTKIRAINDLDGLSLMIYVANMSDAAKATKGMLEFLQQVIVDEDWPVFRKAVADAKYSLEQVTQIGGWLLEVFTTYPTTSPSDSSSGPAMNGSGSTASLPSGVSV